MVYWNLIVYFILFDEKGLVEGNHDSNKVVALVGNKIDLENDRKISKDGEKGFYWNREKE